MTLQIVERPILLVGMPGAGKSSVGRLLAEHLGLPFVDADDEVEREAGLSISEIFARDGEAGFRVRERQVMLRLIDGSPSVIAAGGGAFLDQVVQAAALERCTTVWLQADPELLAARLARGQPRPLLNGRVSLPELKRLANEREDGYAGAHLHLESAQEPPSVTVARVVRALTGSVS